jgi:putative sterol carrier protein
MSPTDLRTATPEQLRELPAPELISRLKVMSDAELGAVMSSENRSHLIAAVFESMPALFRAEKAGATSTATHWSITERPDGGSDDWTIRIADGQCAVAQGHEGDATLALAMGPEPFVKLITKSGNPVMMFMTGKVKAKGDLSMAANFSSLFDIAQG